MFILAYMNTAAIVNWTSIDTILSLININYVGYIPQSDEFRKFIVSPTVWILALSKQ